MAHALRFFADISTAGALLGCAYTLLLSVVVLRFRPDARSGPTAHPPVTILKPLCGAEPDLFARLASFCTQDYPGPIELVCGVQTMSDPAIDVVRRLQVRYAAVPITIQVDTHEHGCNRKVSNLINMLPLARYDTLVICDSDMEVGSGYLAETIATLERSEGGAATCLYHGIACETVPSRLAALAINTHFLPQAVAAFRFRLAQPCFGATIAIRRTALNQIGGLRAFADVLAEDYAIGKAVRNAGLEVALAPGSLGHVCLDVGVGAMLSRQLRVARTIKVIDPIGYAGTAIAHPFALAVLGVLLGASGAGGLVAGALACRIMLCMAVQRAFGLPPQPYWMIPLHDLAAFTIYVVSFAGSTVTWHGYKYRVANDGTIVEHASRAG
ncbi:MAG TPA: bacteriohopanetetrol glucosamine biosynthesis glycosyltransferase HpnI [Xanthobacteraceae bacterium]|nr:bacteriohopanetetrol glucosamine biosynthesis glycosyltransferase HpnI [Xanthobacteraceae bacterium]